MNDRNDPRKDYRNLPDVRDGLNEKERIVLYCLYKTQIERGDRNVPTAMLYGRVVEHIDMSVAELQSILQRLTGKGGFPPQLREPFAEE